jgi:hypothetical protein
MAAIQHFRNCITIGNVQEGTTESKLPKLTSLLAVDSRPDASLNLLLLNVVIAF